MEATASAPVAVASSSTPNNSNRPIFINNTTSDPKTISFPAQSRPTTAPKDKTIPWVLPNRPFSMSDRSNVPVQHNRPTSVSDSISTTTFPSVRTNNSQNSTESINTRVFSPRRRRNNGEQKPQNAQPSQNAQNQRSIKAGALLLQAIQEPQPGRILVTGYPTYTQPHDLLEVFTKFGNVRIDKCNSFSATLTYATDEQAKNAIGANKRLHIYGHFLSIRPYSAKLNAFEGPQSPKRDFSMSKQKSMIIEPNKIDLSGDFYSQLDKILAAIRLNQEEINKISTLYGDLEAAFQPYWPGCKAIPFGSITTGLGIKTSDADCFISLPLEFRVPNGNFVNRARRLLMLQPDIFAEILAIPRANTPIVKFYHVPTGTNCDLTFKTPLGAQNSRLIAFLLSADPRISPMAVIIKYWAKVHDLSGTGKLTNYTLTLMIIFYLQQPPLSILPSVAWLQRDRSNDMMVDCWNTGYMNNIKFLPPITNTSSIPELIGGFFEYYANFDFDEMVVCPYLGTKIKKAAFADTASLPNEYNLYRRNLFNNYVMPIRFQTSFCVQDPFEQCHNVASTITSRLALDIRTFIKFAAAAFEKEKSNNYARFLPIILLEKPKLIRPKSNVEYRVNLFPRIINTIIDFEWKNVVRDLVSTIFEKMLKIKLGKVEEKMNPDSRKEKEKYTGSLTKPIWKRKRYNCFGAMGHPDLGFEEKQSCITEELIKREEQDIALQFVLTLVYCHDPKSAVISMKFNGGDIDGFREFGKFFISVMQGWFTQLLKPHSMPNCRDTAAKIAATTVGDGKPNNDLDSDDDEEEIVLTPSTKPAQKKPAEEKTSANISDFAMADEDVRQDGDSGLPQDSIVDVAKLSIVDASKVDIVGKNGVVAKAKNRVVDVAKEDVVNVAKEDVVNVAKDVVVDVVNDSVADVAKDVVVGVVNDSVADVAKDVFSLAIDGGVNVAKDGIIDVAKDSVVDVTNSSIVDVPKVGVVDVPLDIVDVPRNGADDVPRDVCNVPSNSADNSSRDGAPRNDIDEVLRDAADAHLNSANDLTQDAHDKPQDSGHKEKVACANE